jgi:hypothetical protein
MAWERRGDNKYYDSARKVDGKVVKTYHGTGLFGVLAAEAVADAGRARAAERDALAAEEARMATADRAMAALDAACSWMIVAALTAAGYRYTDYRWRRGNGRRS